MFRSTIQLFVIASIISGFSASALAEGKKPTLQKRKIANQYSGTRVGSSNTFKIPSLNPKDVSTDISRVEKILVLKQLEGGGSSGGRVALVQIDGGGSTDIGSVMTSSSLYLVFFLDGEENNKKAVFQLDEINTFDLKQTAKNNYIIEKTCKNETLKTIKVDSVLNFEEFEKKFMAYSKNGANDFEDITVPGEITMTNRCLPNLF